MFDFKEAFANGFEDYLKGMAEMDPSIRKAAERLSLQPLQAKKCETRRELGDWFANFAKHCKALRPAEPA